MVYIFKKLNNLTGDASNVPAQTGSIIGGQGTSNENNQNPHASSFQNPSNIYQANLGENLGKLDTGLTKNIQDTQASLNNSDTQYKSSLNNINSQYGYNGLSDLQNVGDSNTYSRLSKLINPAVEQNDLNSIQSNSNNYNPDTQGLASSSTIEGLSNQLKNQYGTSAGGSRLDAQLYRGSGQAGAAINDNLNQLDSFKQNKQNLLGQQSDLLNQYNQGAVDKSNKLQSEGSNYQNQLLSQSQDSAKQIQNTYDTSRQNALNADSAQAKAINPRQFSIDTINKAFGDNQINNTIMAQGFDDAERRSNISGQLQQQGIPGDIANQLAAAANIPQDADQSMRRQANINLTDYFKNSLADKFSSNMDLNSIKPESFVGGPKTFDANSYLDPRYNMLGSLLGTNQIAGTSQQDSSLSNDSQGYTNALNNYLSQQTSGIGDAVSSLLNPNYNYVKGKNPYVESLASVLGNPLLMNSVLSSSVPGAGFTPGGRKLSDSVSGGLTNAIRGIGGYVSDGVSGIGSALGF